MVIKKHYLLFFLIGLLGTEIRAQFKGKLNVHDFKLAHDHGIPGVYDMFQDSLGTLWFGSTNGIYRYNGTQIVEFTGQEKKILGKTNYSFFQEPNGDVLIGSDYGVCRYSLRKNNVELLIHLDRPFDERHKYAIIGYDRQKYLWLSVDGIGIARYKHHLEFIPDPGLASGAKPDRLKQGYVDLASNRIYLSNHLSTAVYVNASDLSIHPLNVPLVASFKKIGSRLFVVGLHQLVCLNEKGEVTGNYPFPKTMLEKMKTLYTKVTVANDSCLWISGMDGVWVFNFRRNVFSDCFGFNNDARCEHLTLVSELFTDKFGSTWICSETKGIRVVNPFSQKRFQYANGDAESPLTVMDVASLNDSLVLICPLVDQPRLLNLNTNRCLALFPKNQETGISFKVERLNNKHVLLYNGNKKAYLFDLSTLKLSAIHTQPRETPIVKVLVTEKNSGYLLSHSEIFRFQFNDNHIQLGAGTSLGTVFNSTVLHDAFRHRLVFSTREHSLLINDSTLTILTDTLPVFGAFNAYVASRDGSLWLATRLGLKHIGANYQLLKTYTTEHGLNNDVIYALQFNADSSCLFLSTNTGISQLDLRSSEFQNYTMLNGLQESEHNSGASDVDSRGIHYFGNISGITFFSEKTLQPNSAAPRMILGPITVNDSLYQHNLSSHVVDSIVLASDFRNLSLQYTLLQSSEPEQRRYSYRLAGFEQYWHSSETPPQITYQNLPPGTYTLHMMGCVKKACTEKQILLFVLPPFYQTWWFLLVVIVLACLLFFLMVLVFTKARIRRQEKKLETERRLLEQKNQISRDLHDNVGARLSMMLNTIDWMHKTGSFDPAIVNDLQDSTKSVIQNLRETIWVMNKEEITAVELFDKIKTYALQFFRNQSTRLSFSEHLPANKTIPSEQTLNLFRITQEALNNIFKYAAAGEVKIAFNYVADNLFEIHFQDNGVGFDLATYRAGNGIINMRERAQEINAQFNIRSEPGSGTFVSITFYSK